MTERQRQAENRTGELKGLARKQRTILLIEGDRTVREVMGLALPQKLAALNIDANVVVAKDPAELGEILTGRKMDAILITGQISDKYPGMTGPRLAVSIANGEFGSMNKWTHIVDISAGGVVRSALGTCAAAINKSDMMKEANLERLAVLLG